jgi:hypothetical protein
LGFDRLIVFGVKTSMEPRTPRLHRQMFDGHHAAGLDLVAAGTPTERPRADDIHDGGADR